MEPLVYIILINYNGFKDTAECIRSLKDINYTNYKILVVDNCSTKEPEKEDIEYIKSNCVWIDGGFNRGFSGGNNLGIKYAIENGADYLLLLNNDTTVEPDFLNLLVNTACNKNNVGLVCGKILYYADPNRIWFAGGSFNKKTAMTSHHKNDEINVDDSDRVEEITFATGCLWLIPKTTVEKIGYMNEDFFMYSEDDDYSCRIINAGMKILYRNNSIIYHKIGRSSGGLSKTTQYYMVRNGFYIIKKYSSHKAYAYVKRVVFYAKRVIKRKYSLTSVVGGIIGFLSGEKGMHSFKFNGRKIKL